MDRHLRHVQRLKILTQLYAQAATRSLVEIKNILILLEESINSINVILNSRFDTIV